MEEVIYEGKISIVAIIIKLAIDFIFCFILIKI